MIFIQPGLFVRIEQFRGERAPQPLPLVSGFREDTAYKVLGVYNPSESGEAYFILANGEDQIWFISNRHLRAHAVLPEANEFYLPLAQTHVHGSAVHF